MPLQVVQVAVAISHKVDDAEGGAGDDAGGGSIGRNDSCQCGHDDVVGRILHTLQLLLAPLGVRD